MDALNDAINKLDVTIPITDGTRLHTHKRAFLTNCVAIKSRPRVDGHYIKDLSPHWLSDLSAAVSHFMESDVIGQLWSSRIFTCVCYVWIFQRSIRAAGGGLFPWKEHDLFFPSAIWCAFSGLIRGKHSEASVFCRWQRWEHRDKDNRWKRPWYADGTGAKPTGHAPLGAHWKSHVLSFLLLGSPLAPTTALAILPRVRHTGSIHQNILRNLHLKIPKLKQQ